MLTFKELELILLKAEPSKDLESRKEELFDLMEEFRKCDGFDQKNDWHIYDVLTHIFKVVDNVPAMLPLRIAALFHDVGKPEMHYTDKDGVNHYPNHWMLAQVAFHKYKQFFTLSKEETRLISNLIYDHDKPLVKNNFYKELYNDRYGNDLEQLFMLKRADILASNPTKHDEYLKKLGEVKDMYFAKQYVNH